MVRVFLRGKNKLTPIAKEESVVRKVTDFSVGT
jgi:hypothetical protein